jgi:hypothetical protein
MTVLSALCAGPTMAAADDGRLGQFTAVQGNVFAARAAADHPILIQQDDPLKAQDLVQTEPRSRAKVLLNDDTLLAMGEDSRLTVVESTHEQTQDRRVLVLKLTQGRVRVLVGRKFTSPGSRVELRTPSGTVSAREGSFAAWVDSSPASDETPAGSTGVTNIGRTPINFSASGEQVTLVTGQSSVAQSRRPPSQPELFRTALAAVNRAVQDTQIRDQLKPQSPREVLRASGGPDTKTPRPVTSTAPPEAQTPGKQPPLIPVTPPAVISGAATTQAVSTPAPSPPPAAPSVVTPTPVAPIPTPTPVAPTPVVTVPVPVPVTPTPTITIPLPSIPTLPTTLPGGNSGPSGNSGPGSQGRGGGGRD